jgi:mannose-6-phosphate isomerase-like protein (cupin superfamily)
VEKMVRTGAGIRIIADMNAAIHPFAPDTEFFTDEQCHIIELANTPDDPDVSIARARVEPGITTRRHRLAGTAERYVILEGRGRVEIGDLHPREVGPGDVVLIPPDCPQRIANLGAADLVFLAVCSPRFRPECYQDLDHPRP